MENIESMIEKMRPRIEASLEEAFATKVAASLSYSLESKIGEFVSEYIKVNVLPAVGAKLAENKDVIAAAICVAVEQSCMALGEKLKERAIQKLANSWSVDSITKELFNG